MKCRETAIRVFVFLIAVSLKQQSAVFGFSPISGNNLEFGGVIIGMVGFIDKLEMFFL